MKLQELLEKRDALSTEMRSINDKAAAESRDYTDAEDTRHKALKTEIAGLDRQIERARDVAEAERSAPAIAHSGRVGDGQFEDRARQFSIVKAIRAALPRDVGGGGVDAGFEREISAEVARRSGRVFEGIAVPDQIFLQEKRTLLAGSTAADLVPNVHRADLFIDRLRSSLACERLGATILDGLVGTIDIPRQNGSATAMWVAEDQSLTESDPSFDDITLAPKTVGAITSFSRRTLLNASPSIEQIVRNDLAAIIARAIDAKALVGDGTSNTPTGITHTSGVVEHSISTHLDWESLLGMVAQIEAADALQGSLGWALNAWAVRKLRSTVKSGPDGNSPPTFPAVAGGFLMDSPGTLAGYPAVTTSALTGNPNNGSSPTIAQPATMIFGDFSSLLIGYWSGVDVLVNPYMSPHYEKGRVAIRAMRDVDIQLRRPESFVFVDDVSVNPFQYP